MIPPTTPVADLYRLEHTPAGERLLPVHQIEEATHSGIVLLRRVMEAHAREVVDLRAEAEHLRHRVQQLQEHLARQHDLADRVRVSLQRLVAHNRTLIGEKRRLRDALAGKKPLPNVHLRIEVDRDGVARENMVMTLDAFPHRDHLRAALAEARRLADRRGGQVRQVRLDTSAWRAVIQKVVEE